MRGKQQPAKQNTEQSGITPAGAGKTLTVARSCFASADHPRRCGENISRAVGFGGERGSPPQVRGKRRAKKVSSHIQWITPAGAGKTMSPAHCAGTAMDHPRRCGENMAADRVPVRQVGSPPQVRGKHFHYQGIRGGDRITPAGAGKTGYEMAQEFTKGDHPRRCGENSCALRRVLLHTGSPPQVRGKLR